VYSQSQNPKPIQVLFIGNSYIYVNKLPQVLTSIANSTNNGIQADQSVKAGYTLKLHSEDTNTLSKIKKGIWDYVVLQEQSQLPAAEQKKVKTEVLPYAHFLDSMAHHYNPHCKTIFYSTWGRKSGDSLATPFQTYEWMDSLLTLRYTLMAKTNHATLSPVGTVWKYIRSTYPSIELYHKDGSHPSEAGTYAAACCFYSILFKKDPTTINFTSRINESDALKIKNSVKEVVFDKLKNWYFD
jgi:hypothetical protein